MSGIGGNLNADCLRRLCEYARSDVGVVQVVSPAPAAALSMTVRAVPWKVAR